MGALGERNTIWSERKTAWGLRVGCGITFCLFFLSLPALVLFESPEMGFAKISIPKKGTKSSDWVG